MAYGRSYRVQLDGIDYRVRFFEDGRPQSIKKRVMTKTGWHDQPYWHYSRSLGSEKTKPSRIVAIARHSVEGQSG